MTKKALRKIRAKAGQAGGLAPHKIRGFQGIPPERVKEISAAGVKARLERAP